MLNPKEAQKIKEQILKQIDQFPPEQRDSAKEQILAMKIEREFSKKQILYIYLNQIYLGHGAYGIQAAASNFFNKNIKDLTLAEAALLAGLVQAPSKLPNIQYAKERQEYVLTRMIEDKYITKQHNNNKQY